MSAQTLETQLYTCVCVCEHICVCTYICVWGHACRCVWHPFTCMQRQRRLIVTHSFLCCRNNLNYATEELQNPFVWVSFSLVSCCNKVSCLASEYFAVAVTGHGIFPLIGGFLPIERSHGSFLRSVQIRWENHRVYLTCERFSKSNFPSLPCTSILFLHSTFSNHVDLFCFGHQQSVHVVKPRVQWRAVAQSSLVSQPFMDSRWIGGHFSCASIMFRKLANWWQTLWKIWPERLPTTWS